MTTRLGSSRLAPSREVEPGISQRSGVWGATPRGHGRSAMDSADFERDDSPGGAGGGYLGFVGVPAPLV